MLKRTIATYELAEEKGNRFGTYALDEVKGHWKMEEMNMRQSEEVRHGIDGYSS